MMASANVELVKGIYAAWDRGDFTHVDWAHPEIEYEIIGGPLTGSSVGLARMAQRWRSFLGAWTDFGTQVDEFRELDDERVLVLHRFFGRGRQSGVEVGPTQSRGACVFHVRGGRVARLVLFSSREDAVVELGLAGDG
jgi:ketosteroid isomerase-like protein